MADEKAKIVTDATGPGSGPAPDQPEAAAQVPKQEQPAPDVLAPDKAEAPRPGKEEQIVYIKLSDARYTPNGKGAGCCGADLHPLDGS